MGISIVIRCYNEEEHIGKLLAGVLAQSIKDVEILLVDSGSTDATLSIARQFPVEVLEIAPGDFSFGRSLNLGCRAAHHPLIVIASAHVYPVYPDWLERLCAPFSDPRVGLTYGKQRGDPHSNFSEQQILARWFPDGAGGAQVHPFCNNANAAIRRLAWEKRPYDESLSGLEDLDWARWAQGEGYQIHYTPEAEIIHVHNETPQGVYNRYRREAMAFKRIYPEEKFGLFDRVRLTTSNIASDAWQARRQKCLMRNMGSIVWFRWQQFRGTYVGYRQAGPLNEQLRQTFYYPADQSMAGYNKPRTVEPIHYEQLKRGERR